MQLSLVLIIFQKATESSQGSIELKKLGKTEKKISMQSKKQATPSDVVAI